MCSSCETKGRYIESRWKQMTICMPLIAVQIAVKFLKIIVNTVLFYTFSLTSFIKTKPTKGWPEKLFLL